MIFIPQFFTEILTMGGIICFEGQHRCNTLRPVILLSSLFSDHVSWETAEQISSWCSEELKSEIAKLASSPSYSVELSIWRKSTKSYPSSYKNHVEVKPCTALLRFSLRMRFWNLFSAQWCRESNKFFQLEYVQLNAFASLIMNRHN